MRAQLVMIGVLLLFALPACERYEIVRVKRSPMLGLPGTESQLSDRRIDPRTYNPSATPAGGIRHTDEETGEITLIAKTARHVMVHVYTTLAADEKELFVEQVLSERTKQEFYEHGLDPAVAFDELKNRERDILRLFNTMPYGEATPGVFPIELAPNTFRLHPKRAQLEQLPWTYMDVVVEHGQWRLRWFG